MEHKIISCPHCGKIIPDYALKGEPKRMTVTCPSCGSHRNSNDGKRGGKVQRYLCRDCGYRFT